LPNRNTPTKGPLGTSVTLAGASWESIPAVLVLKIKAKTLFNKVFQLDKI
jgi:hypothetical protein